MKRIFRENLRLFQNGRSFFQFELLYKLLGASVSPALLAIFRLSIRAAGLSYLTNDNLWLYLKNPFAFLGTVLILLFLAYYILVEMTAMAIWFHLREWEQELGPTSLLAAALKRSLRIFRPRNLLMVLFLVLIIPLTNVALVSGYLTTIRIPEFIIRYIAKRKPLIFGVAALLLLFFFLAMRWVFSIHYFVLEHKPFRPACKASANLIRRQYLPTLGRIFLWETAVHGGLLLLYFLFLGAAYLLSKAFVPGGMAMTVFLQAFHWINILVLVFGSCLTIPISFTAVSGEFYRLKQEKGEPISLVRALHLPSFPEGSRKRWSIGATALLLASVMGVSYLLPEIRSGRFGTLEALQTPRITAHRGNSSRAPENTMAAFQSALDAGADCIEFDVQQLSDGTIIVMHDSNFHRTTGIRKNVWEATWEEVEAYDAGSWFSSDFAGEKIPLLEEVLDFANGKIFLNIELKATGKETNLEEEVVRLIKEHHFETQCVLTSQQYSVLRTVKELASELQTGYVLSVAYGRFYDMEDVDLFSVRSDFITASMVRELHNRGKLLYGWTVNEEDRIRSLNELRVDDIITDDPKYVQTLLSMENTGETYLGLFRKLFWQNGLLPAAKDFWKATFGK